MSYWPEDADAWLGQPEPDEGRDDEPNDNGDDAGWYDDWEGPE